MHWHGAYEGPHYPDYLAQSAQYPAAYRGAYEIADAVVDGYLAQTPPPGCMTMRELGERFGIPLETARHVGKDALLFMAGLSPDRYTQRF